MKNIRLNLFIKSKLFFKHKKSYMETTEMQPVKEKFYFQVAPGVWGMKDIFVNMYISLKRSFKL